MNRQPNIKVLTDAPQLVSALNKEHSTKNSTDTWADAYALLREGKRFTLASVGRQRERILYGKPKIALVVGTFAAVPYVHLHLEARRRLYPDIPLLVHDDHSPKAGELAALCRSYDAEFVETATRFPPSKGDLSAIAYGLAWARERGVDVLVKMSRRFVPKIRWVDGLKELVEESDYATYSSWTTSFGFGFRTECLGLAVGEWFARGLVDDLTAAIYASETPFMEGFMHDLARRAAITASPAAQRYDAHVGARTPERDGYAVWPFIGTDRCTWSADYIWHDSEGEGVHRYAELARLWKLPYQVVDFIDPNMGHGTAPIDDEAPLQKVAGQVAPKTAAGLRIVVYTICHNEEVLMPFFARHYAWAEQIVVYDDASTDRTREVLQSFPQVEVRAFDSGGILDDSVIKSIKNHCWKECRGKGIDFVIVVDADEFVWAENLGETLQRLKGEGATLIRPTGYDMIAAQTPSGSGLLTTKVRRGVVNPDYSKPCIFSPDALKEIIFTAGCRDCGPRGDVNERRTDEIRLLHYRFLGADFYLERAALRRARGSENNQRCEWGFHYERSEIELRYEFAVVSNKSQVILPDREDGSGREAKV